MPDQQHPITLPQELFLKWTTHREENNTPEQFWRHIATEAAQWGADQELDACCEWLAYADDREKLRADRRPKPPSLKEQALGLLNEGPVSDLLDHEVATIRRALESLE